MTSSCFHFIPLRLSATGFIGCCLFSTAGTVVAERSEQAPKRCVEATTRAPYVAYGYDHIVVLKNTCTKTQTCVVKTDATPKPQTVRVPGKETKEVITRRGSPARAFTPNVVCK